MRLYAYAAVTLVAGVSAAASLTVDADSPPWEAVAEVELDAAPAVIALARAGVVQEAGVEIRIDGVAIPHEWLRGDWEYSRSRRQSTQGGHFGVALDEWGVSPLGDSFAALGCPFAGDVEFWGCYRDDDTGTVYRYPLGMRNRADTPSRESGPGGHVEDYQVLDPGARWPRIPVTMVLPPGHGLPTGRIVKKALAAAGETQFNLEDGRRRYKEFQLVDGDAVGACQELLDVEGRVLRWDRYGNAVCPTLKPSSLAAPYSINEEDILDVTTVRVVFPPDAVTDVTVTGTAQVHEDTAEEACGDVVGPDVRVETFKNFAPWNAGFSQAIGCTLSALAVSEAPRTQPFTLTVTRQVTRCGTVKREESESWAYFTPEAARYAWASGTRGCVAGVYLAQGSAEDDGSPAFSNRREFWALIGMTRKEHFYDAPGWTGPLVADAIGGNDPHFLGSPAGEETGQYLGSIERRQAYYNPRAAMKSQPGTPTSYELLPVDDVFQLGNGTTVRDARQTFVETALLVEIVRGSGGYRDSEQALGYGYAVRPNGTSFQFSDGALSGDSTELFVLVADTLSSYADAAENQHVATTVPWRLGQATESTSETRNGARPELDYLPGWEPYDAGEFVDEEDAEFGVEARAGETRPIKVQLTVPDLLAAPFNKLPRIVKTSFPYAEDEDELYSACRDIVRESLIIRAVLTLTANFLLAEDVAMLVTHRPSGMGVDWPCVVDSIAWGGSPESPVVTTLGLEKYPALV